MHYLHDDPIYHIYPYTYLTTHLMIGVVPLTIAMPLPCGSVDFWLPLFVRILQCCAVVILPAILLLYVHIATIVVAGCDTHSLPLLLFVTFSPSIVTFPFCLTLHHPAIPPPPAAFLRLLLLLLFIPRPLHTYHIPLCHYYLRLHLWLDQITFPATAPCNPSSPPLAYLRPRIPTTTRFYLGPYCRTHYLVCCAHLDYCAIIALTFCCVVVVRLYPVCLLPLPCCCVPCSVPRLQPGERALLVVIPLPILTLAPFFTCHRTSHATSPY